jgi:hypothetical protein
MTTAFNSFWFGHDLPPYQQLALKSFVDFGHRYTLYSYRKFNVPAGVEQRDANDVLSESRVFFYGNKAAFGRGSVSGFSNLFRYELLYRFGGWWIDTDVICLSDKIPAAEIFMGWESADLIGTALLRFPEDHFLVKGLRDAAEQLGTDISWGESGPGLLTRLVRERNLSTFVSPQDYCYPVGASDALSMLIPSNRENIRAQTRERPFLHLWNEMFRRTVVHTSVAPPPGSFMAELFERHRIGFGAAPTYTEDQIQRLNEIHLLHVRLAEEVRMSAFLARRVQELEARSDRLNKKTRIPWPWQKAGRLKR